MPKRKEDPIQKARMARFGAEIKEWQRSTMKLSSPEHEEQMEQQNRRDWKVIFDAGVAPQVSRRIVKYHSALGHYYGILRGFRMGWDAAKLDVEDPKNFDNAERTTIGMLTRRPGCTARDLCRQLDRLRIALPSESQTWALRFDKLYGQYPGRKHRAWQDVLDDPALRKDLDVYFSRLRKRAQRISKVKAWKKLIRAHHKFRN